MLVALLVGTYLLPAYTASDPAEAAQVPSLSAQLQSVRVSSTSPTDAAAPTSRDGFTVTKAVPVSDLYSTTGDTFSNDPNSPIQWPFPVGAPISSWFGYRDCEGCPTFHKGIDINPGRGTPIQAVADGVVTEVGADEGGYGTYVIITHQIDGEVIGSRYAHMVEGSSPLALGDVVTVGALVGQVGNSGLSTGAHLHFEILLDGDTPTDPYAWMKAKIGS